mgnify:CR=1 FL=1
MASTRGGPYADPVPTKLDVDKTSPVPHTFNLAELVLDEVEVVEKRVGVGRVGRVVVERRDGAKEVEGEVKRALQTRKYSCSTYTTRATRLT